MSTEVETAISPSELLIRTLYAITADYGKGFDHQTERSVRPTDIVGRIGGDEFLVLLPDCSPDEAKTIGERIRSAIAARPIAVVGDDGLALQRPAFAAGMTRAAWSPVFEWPYGGGEPAPRCSLKKSMVRFQASSAAASS